MAEWYQEKIGPSFAQLDLGQRTEVLTEVKLKLYSLKEVERAELVKNVDLKPLFEMLTSNDKYEVDQLCDAIAIFSQVAEPGYVLWNYSSDIYELMSHNQSIVKAYALGEILIAASNPDLLPKLMTMVDLLLKTITLVADNDIGVAQIAMKILFKIGEHPEGLKMLFSGAMLRALAKVLTHNDVAKFRVYDVVVHIAVYSKVGLAAAIDSGYLHDLLRTYDTDDILLQLNVLQTMAELATTEGGLEFLEEQGMIKKLADRIATIHDSPLDAMLIPGLMMFFGYVAKIYPQEVFSKYPMVISALDDVLNSQDELLIRVAIETFAHVASTMEGKYAIQEYKSLRITGMSRIGEVIQRGKTQFKIDALKALTEILTVKESEQDAKSLELIKSWFNLLGEKPLEIIVTLCKQPFNDVRMASLQVLAAIASLPWGQEMIANYPGLVEFLLDRNIESFKECKEAKYQVVKNLTQTRESLFDPDTMLKLKKFVSDGPFYVEVVTEVALEEAS